MTAPTSSTSGESALRPVVRAVRRTVSAHRRLVAALLAGLAVAASLTALRPPSPPTRDVVVAARDLTSGTTLTASDLEIRSVTADDVAAHTYDSTDAVVGEVIAAPMRRGESLTDVRLLTSELVAGYPDGTTLATVRIADPQSLWGVEVGTYVDIVGVDLEGRGDGGVLARNAQVVAMPSPPEDEGPGVTAGAVLVVGVPRETAVDLADASSRMQLAAVVSDGGSTPTGSR